LPSINVAWRFSLPSTAWPTVTTSEPAVLVRSEAATKGWRASIQPVDPATGAPLGPSTTQSVGADGVVQTVELPTAGSFVVTFTYVPKAAVIGMVVAIVATWRPGLLPSGAPGHRLEFHLPEWALVCIALAVGAVFVAIVAILLPAPRRKDPDDFVLELPPSPRLSPAALIVMLVGIVLAVAVAVVLLHMLSVQDSAGHAGPIGPAGASPTGGPAAAERSAVYAGAVTGTLL